MSTIENNVSQGNYLGLLKNVPNEILSKISISNSFATNEVKNEIEVITISGESVDKLREFVDSLGGKYDDLGYNFAIVTIPVDKLTTLALSPLIQYIELPKSLYLADTQANDASCVTQAVNTYKLDGEGVLVGFIDTGIDYTNLAFRNDDGTTRIEYIYDLDDNGKVYSKKDIDEALKSNNPFSVVNSQDISGHGTHVAGIACAGGKISRQLYGVAPKSSIAMVKVARTQFALSTFIMKGLRFLLDKSKELNMPLVINISLNTNDGAHNGSSLLEQYIFIVSNLERVTIVVAAGNEGEAAHHISGEIKDTNEILFNVGQQEVTIAINLYKSILPDLSVEIITPTAISSGQMFLAQGFRVGRVGDSIYEIYDTGPKPFDISGEIGIFLRGQEEYVSAGQWKIIIRPTNKYKGTYNMWLPISEGLNTATKFLNPVEDNTLGIPATVVSVISVGSYNYLTNNISPFSGRGEMYAGQYVKPDIVAPGEDIYSVAPNNSFDKKTGTSMAAPNVTGICALMTQWGIIQQKDPYLYGERLKYYLILGAKRKRSDVTYPNPAWGYGEVCIYDSLRLTASSLGPNRGSSFRQDNDTNSNNMSNTVVVPNSTVTSTNNTSNTSNTSTSTNNVSSDNEKQYVLVELPDKERLTEILKIPNVEGIMLSETFALLLLPESEMGKIEPLVNSIVDFQLLPIFTLTDISPIQASGTPLFNNNPYLNLNGKGVLVGIIDTGIDYLNEEFQREDGTSRVFRIWDQTIPSGVEVQGFKLGTEYTEEQITEAIDIKQKGGDPYSIVPSKDEIGHGTMMAGICGGRGINPDLKGAAPDCEFVVVKLQRASALDLKQSYIQSNVPTFNQWSILLGVRYIASVANYYKKPLVIYIPLGTNYGDHFGNGIIERSISNYSRQVGTVIVTNTGNQGNSATHIEGVIQQPGDTADIQLRVGKNQKILPVEIYVNKPNIVTMSISSPSGETIENLTSKVSRNQKIKFTYETTEMIINFTSPDYITGDTFITIKATNLKEGIWKIRLVAKSVIDGRFYAWIPQRELIEDDTKFLNSSVNTTLTMPSTATGCIAVSFYNQNNNSVVSEAGRGYTVDNRIKPDIAAGGVNATVIKPGGQVAVANGASIAGAVVTGACALILQWAVTDKNDVDIYQSQIKFYIIGGAKRRDGDTYPNREWGYGMFDLEGVFNSIREVYSEEDSRLSKQDDFYDEYNVGNLYVRKPTDI